MLILFIGCKNIVILVKGYLECLLDVDGILYFVFNNYVKEIVFWLVGRLKELGFVFNLDKVVNVVS